MTVDDVNYVNMSIPDAKAALDGNSIDVALLAGPTAYKAKEQGYKYIAEGARISQKTSIISTKKN